MKVALAQFNTTVGDLAGNEAKILAAYQRGIDAGVELVICPELSVCGYPPRDLLQKRSFIPGNWAVVQRLAAATGKVGLLIGYAGSNDKRPGREATNSAALLQNGGILATRHKTLLPTYDVFDEDRYFEPATENLPVTFNGQKIGITICEDIWNDEDFWKDRRYQRNPAVDLANAGATLLLNISASPWHLGKNNTRREMLASFAAKTGCPLLYCNLVGGNDELVFDGASMAFDGTGQLGVEGVCFGEDFLVVDTAKPGVIGPHLMEDEESIYRALVLGLRDYVHKCGFKSVVLGLSGGIDSALTAVIAVEALGPENVRGVSLPSQYSSQGSLDDAQILAQNLGIQHDVIPIQNAFESVKAELQPVFAGRKEDTAEENIQARLRGVILMAMSNKFGSLLLTTGNKSELATGYCTLYGDMAGGFAAIKDLSKTTVFRLARWRNANDPYATCVAPIPERIITRPPSAELRPDQTDQDSLPPYHVLDEIVERYMENDESVASIVASGIDAADAERVTRLIKLNEYKRRQAPIGIRVTHRSFGKDWRYPITSRFR